MACLQTLKGIERDCSPNIGGIKTVYIANFEDVDTLTILSDAITAITMNNSAVFKKYDFRAETGSLTKTLNVNKQNGTSYVHTALALTFGAMDTAKRVELVNLATGMLAVIAVDNNGRMWYLGKENPVTADSGESGTGTAFADANAYGIVLGDDSKTYPMEFTGTVPV